MFDQSVTIRQLIIGFYVIVGFITTVSLLVMYILLALE